VALFGHADSVAQCPLSGAKRKTCARIELFRFGPKADVRHLNSPRRLLTTQCFSAS
jgi:hypothetical protein